MMSVLSLHFCLKNLGYRVECHYVFLDSRQLRWIDICHRCTVYILGQEALGTCCVHCKYIQWKMGHT